VHQLSIARVSAMMADSYDLQPSSQTSIVLVIRLVSLLDVSFASNEWRLF